MACNGKTYIPNPPRMWSRVQNDCSNLGLSQMLIKGNVLQYKKNSTNLSKKQTYSKIAKGQWINRNTTWATQNDRGYTNPNTSSLKRVNQDNIAIDPNTGQIIGSTTLPQTCPTNPSQNNSSLPEQGGSGEVQPPNPELPPIEPPSVDSGTRLPSGNTQAPVEPIVVPDFGTLLCNTVEIPCSSYSKTTKANQFCNPTTASDVPGHLELLCWDESMQPWYTKQTGQMNTSANKWPNTSGAPENTTYIAATAYPNN